MRNKIVLKSDSFAYPTREERKQIGKQVPRIKRLTVKHKSATISILRNSSIKNAIRDEDIYWWNNCLNNRLGKLTETYIYVITHFQRFQKSDFNDVENKHINKILLDYYIEIFYYYFFSTRDVLGQLLNLFYDLGFDEHKIFLNNQFIEKIPSRTIKEELSLFLVSTKDSYNIRNSFNHRFTPTDTDFRAKKSIIKQGDTTSFYSAKEVKINVFIEDTQNLMKHLGNLMYELDKEVN